MQYPYPSSSKGLLPNSEHWSLSLASSTRSRVWLSYWEPLYLAHDLSGGNTHPGTRWGYKQGWLFGPTWNALTGNNCSRAPAGIDWGLVRPVIYLNCCFILLSPLSFHRTWSLMNILHAKRSLRKRFHRSQPVTLGDVITHILSPICPLLLKYILFRILFWTCLTS